MTKNRRKCIIAKGLSSKCENSGKLRVLALFGLFSAVLGRKVAKIGRF
jgi:hypothetical protein